MPASVRLSTALTRRARESARRRSDRKLRIESLEPRLALATGPLGTLVSIVDDIGRDLLAATSSGTAVPVNEGHEIAAIVRLTRQPSAPVRVGFSNSDPLEVGLGRSNGGSGNASLESPTPLTFTPSNWNIPQLLSIRAIEDGVADGTRQIPLRVSFATAGRAPLARTLWIESVDSSASSPVIAASGTFRGPVEGTGSSGNLAATYGVNKGTATFRVTSAQLANVRDRVIAIDYAVNAANKVVVEAVRGFSPAGLKADLTYRVGSDGVPGLSGTLKLSQPALGKRVTLRVTAALVTPSMPRLDGYAPSTTTKVTVGGSPENIAVAADGSAWVANPGLDAVQRLVRQNGIWTISDTVLVGKRAERVAVAPDGSAWVMNSGDNTLQQIVKQDGRWKAKSPVAVAVDPSAIVVAKDGAVWVASSTANVVQRIAAVNGVPLVTATLSVRAGSAALAIGKDGAIWVASKTANTVQRISGTGTGWVAGIPIAVGSAPASISAAGDGSAWIANTAGNSIQRIVKIGAVWKAQTPIHVGRAVAAVAAHHDGSVWVTHADGGTIQRFVSARSGWTAQAPIHSGGSIAAVSTAPDGSLLVADPQAGTMTAVSAVPAQVQNLAVAATGVGSLFLSWDAPAGGATSYNVTVYNGGTTTTRTTTTTSTSMSFPGLTVLASVKNPYYTFTVTPVNAAGSGTAASTSFMASGAMVSVGSSPRSLVRATDGSLWVANYLSGSIQQILNINGAWTAQPAIAVGTYPLSLAVGLDGSVWVTNGGQSGNVQQFANVNGVWQMQSSLTIGGMIGTTFQHPIDLTTGLDGSIWVSIAASNNVPATGTLMMSTAPGSQSNGSVVTNAVQQIMNVNGTWTPQPAINVGTGPTGLTTGADGSIWVANTQSDTVQRIAKVNGTWVPQPAVSVGSSPSGLTVGSDGSVWVSNNSSSTVQQIAQVNGVWTAQSAIRVNKSPSPIIAGVDGSIWVAFIGSGLIQQIRRVNGAWVAQSAIPFDDVVSALAAGEDGSVWGSFGAINQVDQAVFAPSIARDLAVTAEPGSGEITLGWTASLTGGMPLISYTVTAYQGTTTRTMTTSSTSCTFSGLSLGQASTYFTVVASNFVGTSPVASLWVSAAGSPIESSSLSMGIVTDGTPVTDGGFDGNGYAYSWEALGASPTLAWNGVTFNLASPNQPNCTSAHGQTIPIPQGDYKAINLAGAAVNGSQQNQQLTLSFTDGSTVVWTQSFSDWGSPQNYGHEAIISTQSYRDTSSGGKDQFANRVYGYTYTIPSGKTLASITLPNNSNVRLLDIQMSNSTSVDLSSQYTSWGVANGSTQVSNKKGFDGGGYYYYSGNLGPLVAWGGATFNFGPVPTSNKGQSNVVRAAGQTIELPSGDYRWLYLAGAGANGSQANQSFYLNFSDGYSIRWTQSFSDWCSPSNFSGESIIQMQPNWVNQVGKVHSQTNYVYGYAYQIPAGKTLVSVTLPNNSNVGILGMAML